VDELVGSSLVVGAARGRSFVLTQPLSFWGGLDSATGRLIDAHHGRMGAVIAGRVLVMPSGRGSSSSSSVLAEAIRAGAAPAAIVLAEPDPIVALGAIVARELYGITCPIIVLPREAHARIPDDIELTVEAARDGASLRMFGG